MGKAVILFAPREIRIEQCRFVDEQFVRLARAAYNNGLYERHPHPIDVPEPYPLKDKSEGECVAEEIFDLTNNPSRDGERVVRYGRGRSLSSADIVEVEGQGAYLCMSAGWTKL